MTAWAWQQIWLILEKPMLVVKKDLRGSMSATQKLSIAQIFENNYGEEIIRELSTFVSNIIGALFDLLSLNPYNSSLNNNSNFLAVQQTNLSLLILLILLLKFKVKIKRIIVKIISL